MKQFCLKDSFSPPLFVLAIPNIQVDLLGQEPTGICGNPGGRYVLLGPGEMYKAIRSSIHNTQLPTLTQHGITEEQVKAHFAFSKMLPEGGPA